MTSQGSSLLYWFFRFFLIRIKNFLKSSLLVLRAGMYSGPVNPVPIAQNSV